MSRHHFHTTHENRLVVVTLGWDRPLQGYFMMVQKQDVNDSQDEDIFLFNNMEWVESHPLSLDPFMGALKKLGIALPDMLYQELLVDGRINAGNKMVEWRMQDAHLERKQVL